MSKESRWICGRPRRHACGDPHAGRRVLAARRVEVARCPATRGMSGSRGPDRAQDLVRDVGRLNKTQPAFAIVDGRDAAADADVRRRRRATKLPNCGSAVRSAGCLDSGQGSHADYRNRGVALTAQLTVTL